MTVTDLRRAGVTVVELMIAMVVATVVGSSLLSLIIIQANFSNEMNAIRDARAASKGVGNLLQAEMRMVEISGGVVSADSTSITLRTPYSFGVACGPTGGRTTVSLLPTDTATLADASFSGWAFRTGGGDYTYVPGTSIVPGTASVCATASVRTLAGGWIRDVGPSAVVAAGTVVFLYQTLRYDFRPSTALPGRIGLWRTPMATGVPEEISAPFNTSSRFRFYVFNADTAQSLAPVDLADIRGVQLVLDGESELVTLRDSLPKTYNLTVAIFFKNRNQE